ncbi:putative sterile alpha motif domain-containing protein [Helianthus annuus]|nr:putative sterile alpha motif domain-containing protein [Helianthus annuus]KAJ0891548.1 putative sterile alpha motif domain-containing protein [Helianthus annuus]
MLYMCYMTQLPIKLMVTMDWYSWLSKTNLDPYLVYEYGRTFTHNELQRSDIHYFTHEFLQSMGVSVAKHRLEILKLARRNTGGRPKIGFSKLVSAIAKTRMLLSKRFGRCVSSKCAVHTPKPDPNPFRPQWPSSNLRKNMGFDEDNDEKAKTTMKSGPLDRRVLESYMSPKRVLSVSGPLDRKVQENLMVMYGSPMDTRHGPSGSAPVDHVVGYSPKIGIPYNMVQNNSGEVDVVSSLWSLMFQNMKPT